MKRRLLGTIVGLATMFGGGTLQADCGGGWYQPSYGPVVSHGPVISYGPVVHQGVVGSDCGGCVSMVSGGGSLVPGMIYRGERVVAVESRTVTRTASRTYNSYDYSDIKIDQRLRAHGLIP